MVEMNVKKITFSMLSLTFMVASWSTRSSELVYTPMSPTFGGSPLNGSILLAKASAQNKHKAPLNRKSYADKFEESLQRSYINKIVREVTNLAFGEDTESSVFNKDSIFTSGDYQIEIVTSNPDSITVQITNTLTGEITVVEMPRFG
jgi:curli production assembly/transport component CsgF